MPTLDVYVKEIAGPHVFFIQILIIWQKKKKNNKKKRRRKRRRRMRRRFLYFPFYSLNKSNVFRLTEHCLDVNRGQTNCRYYSDLTRLRGKCSHLLCVSPAVRGSQSTFCAANFHVTLLSLDTHPSAKPLVFCHEG